MTFFSCLFLLVKYLMIIAVFGLVLGRFIPKVNFIPTAIAYFFISFLLMVFSIPLYEFVFLQRKAEIDDAPLELTEDEMPVLRPIPTATVHQDGWLNKLLAYMFIPRTWRLMQNWHCIYKTPNGTEVELVVPKGFECDAASIPRPFRALFNPTGALLLPALLHDFAFKYNQLWYVDQNHQFKEWYVDQKGNFIDCQQFNSIPSDKQREGWDQFLYEAGMQLNGLEPVNWTIRHLGRIGLTKSTWENYRDKNEPAIKPVAPTKNKKCLCKFNP